LATLKQKHTNIHDHLIQLCLKGDRYAQTELYKLYSRAMFNIACRITNDHNEAEDVLQESFISAFKNLHAYKGEATFGAWLKRIVVNRSLNVLKKKKLEVVPIEDEGRYEDIEENVVIDDVLQVEQIKKAIEKLPDGYRVVFSLYLLEGYDHNEIGEILGISTSTSKSQYNRSKKKLRELLRKEDNYEGQVGTIG